MHLRTYYPTVVLSDIHLGTSHSKTIEVSNFLKSVNCDRLILNGDIIDGWHLRKAGTKRWQAKHTDFFKVIMKMMENFGTEVIYVRGNHDDFLDSLVPMTFYNVKIVKEYIKSAVSYISDFEKVLGEFARVRKCDGVICGHIHHPANTYYDGIHYLNSGDWVESLSALTEDADGNWNIMEYHHVLADENEDNKEFTLIHTAS